MFFPSQTARNSRAKNGISFNQPQIIISVLLIVIFLHTQGYCANTTPAATTEMDTMATQIVETVFAPWVRKTALAFGGGWGMFQSIAGGSYKPLLVWGGLGLIFNFIPKMISWF